MFFIHFAVFAFCFVLCRYNHLKLWTSLYISSLCTLCCFAILKIRSNTKKIGQLNPSQLTHMQECINQLMLNLKDSNLEFFRDVLSSKFEDTKVVDDCIVINHNTITTAVFLEINPDKLSETQICKNFAIANNLNASQMLILTSTGETQNIKNLISHLPNIETTIYNDIQTYKMLKAFEKFPDINIKLKKAAKISKLSLLSLALNPKNSKRYLILSFVFIVYSYFFGNTSYYLVFACIALGLSLACKFRLVKPA